MRTRSFMMIIGCATLLFGCSENKTGNAAKTAEETVVTGADQKRMIIAKLDVKPGMEADFTIAAREMIEKSNTEPGCTFYQLYQDPYDKTKFVFVEEYKNQAAVDEHFSKDYFKAFGPKISDLIHGPAEIKVITVAEEVVK